MKNTTEIIRTALAEGYQFEFTTEPKTLLLSNEEAALYWRATGEQPKLYRVMKGFHVFSVDMPHDEALELIHGTKTDWWVQALFNNICGTDALLSEPTSPFTCWHECNITAKHIELLRKKFDDEAITRETPKEHRFREICDKLENEEPYCNWSRKSLEREVKLALENKSSVIKLT